MLLNVKTIHKPKSQDEAIQLLQQAGTYPLYGGGAALQRNPPADLEALVDVSQLGLDSIYEDKNGLRLGTLLTLERMRELCEERAEYPKFRALAALLKEDMPETLRNAFTLGDLLTERNPQSMTLTLLVALGTVLTRLDLKMRLTVGAWLSLQQDVAHFLLESVRITHGPKDGVVAYEKVSRTPADAPIVGAVAYVSPCDHGPSCFISLALCGVAPMPIAQPNVAQALAETGNMETALDNLVLDPPDDHWGSREYRAEMARVLSRRVLQNALEQAQLNA